ncbi:hypothetical protein WP39_20290 [Streptomyces sp. 604F]|nr:hypothetical protein [Streptomyces sp. 604F]
MDGGRPLLDQAADLFLVLVHGGSRRGRCGTAPERGRTLTTDDRTAGRELRRRPTRRRPAGSLR